MTKRKTQLATATNIARNIIQFEIIYNLKDQDEHAIRECEAIKNKLDNLYHYFDKKGKKK